MTRRIVYGHLSQDWSDKELCQWAAGQIGAGGGFSPDARAMGIEIDGEMAAVTIWNCFELHNCLMSIASDNKKRWMTREFLFRSFAYPFLQLGLDRVTTKSDERNAPSIRLALHLGFTAEGRLRNAAGSGFDDIVFGLLKEECRWISRNLAQHTVKYSMAEG